MVTNKEKSFVSAVLYIHNNENTIKYFLRNLDLLLSENFENYEIICVNDNSTDKSIEKIKAYANTVACCSAISIINMSYFQGLEASMIAGIDSAIGDFVFEFDKIFIDYDNKTIMDVYERSLRGFDIVCAKSNDKRRITSKIFYKIFNTNSNNQYILDTETFRILSRRAINRVNAMSKTIPYRKALYSSCGLKLDIISYKSINYSKLLNSKSKISGRKDIALDSLILFTDVAYKISITMTLLMMLITVGVGLYTIITYVSQTPVAGFTPVMLLLSGAFFGVFTLFAIVIKYLSLLVDLVFKKQKYMVESIDKITK